MDDKMVVFTDTRALDSKKKQLNLKIWKLHQEDVKAADIAKELGCGEDYVKRVLRLRPSS